MGVSLESNHQPGPNTSALPSEEEAPQYGCGGCLLRALINQRTFILCLISLIGVLGFAFLHPEQGPNVLGTLPLILGAYAAASASKDISAHWAASKDPNANTEAVISQLNSKG